jgi:hypothetical protein
MLCYGYLGLLRVLVSRLRLHTYSHVGRVYISADLLSYGLRVFTVWVESMPLLGLKVTAS